MTDLRCLLVGMRGGGGEEVFVRELSSDPPPGVEYTLILDHHQSAPGARSRRVTEIAFNRVIQPFLWPLPGLRAYAVDGRFDLVHVHVYPHHLRLSREVPVVMSVSNSYYHYIRDYLHWETPQVEALYRRAGRLLPALRITNELVSWKRLSGISVFSDFARHVLVSRGVPGALVTVIPPGFPVPGALSPQDSAEEFTFLFVGRDPERKGADLVIEAVRKMRREGARTRGVLAGAPAFLDLEGESGFEVYGPVSRSFVYDRLYPRAHALVMPSRAEGYGFTLVEGMSFGLPVVSTRYGSIPEIVEHGVSGLLAPVGDGEAVVDAMRTLAGDRAAARAMGLAGRRRFEQEFTRQRFLERTRSWYDRAGATA